MRSIIRLPGVPYPIPSIAPFFLLVFYVITLHILDAVNNVCTYSTVKRKQELNIQTEKKFVTIHCIYKCLIVFFRLLFLQPPLESNNWPPSPRPPGPTATTSTRLPSDVNLRPCPSDFSAYTFTPHTVNIIQRVVRSSAFFWPAFNNIFAAHHNPKKLNLPPVAKILSIPAFPRVFFSLQILKSVNNKRIFRRLTATSQGEIRARIWAVGGEWHWHTISLAVISLGFSSLQ